MSYVQSQIEPMQFMKDAGFYDDYKELLEAAEIEEDEADQAGADGQQISAPLMGTFNGNTTAGAPQKRRNK